MMVIYYPVVMHNPVIRICSCVVATNVFVSIVYIFIVAVIALLLLLLLLLFIFV